MINDQDYKDVMSYFPPVNPNISNILYEAETTYLQFKSNNPLKAPPKDEFYSADILSNLQQLRIILNSPISSERFIYEIQKLLNAYGPGGLFNKSILNPDLVTLIHKTISNYNKSLELIKESEIVGLQSNLDDLTKNLGYVSIKPKSRRDLTIKDLDISSISIKKKDLSKKNKGKSKKK